ncbi:MAG: sigma-70 family RNA polymerase sigma factor [Sedimentisphaerales bacterium]|nr:sigma-70 family RNA polymerase sigma factor [Sedimentisphaerales bacterium]MBN2843914.1 sigma-70 family RNA polymerase sigma factor [Sedimentisphaerales bacterium]
MCRREEFLTSFVKNNKALFGYILSLVPSHADAEDILQETSCMLWDKFSEFESGTNFLAWARKIARYKVCEYYRKKKKAAYVNIDLLEAVYEKHQTGDLEEHMAALRGCLGKLSENDLNLIQLRFQNGITIKEIAINTDRSVHTLYKRMACLFTLLQSCVRKTMLAWEQ